MTRKRQTYKSPMESNPDLRRWHSNMAQKSEITADVNLRRVVAFCKEIETTPEKLATMSEKESHNLLVDYVDDKSKQINPKSGNPYAGSYIHSTVKAIKSWLDFNGISVKKVNVGGATSRPTLVGEINPTPAILKSIFLAAPTMQSRVCCALVAHAGLRLQTLGDYKGKDGLCVSDFPEMAIEDGKVTFKVIPTMVRVRENLSKAGHQYFTFLSEEGCEYLKAYLEYRMTRGEKLTADSDIIHAKVWNKKFITTINVGDSMRSAMHKVAFMQRPYVLRSYFDTQLLMAESKGKITNQYRIFFMGHVGDMEARYTTNKTRLPVDTIEDMREAYKRSQAFLQTVNTGPSEDQLNLNLRRQMLTLMGFTSEQLDSMNLEQKTDEEIQAMIREKMTAIMVNNGNSQKVIEEAELEKHLSEGWSYVDKIGNGKVIVKLPHA